MLSAALYWQKIPSPSRTASAAAKMRDQMGSVCRKLSMKVDLGGLKPASIPVHLDCTLMCKYCDTVVAPWGRGKAFPWGL